MSRFFFQVHDGRFLWDDIGLELADIRSARKEALRFSGELLADDDGNFWDLDQWRLEVTDGSGSILFSLIMHAIDAPAVLGAVRPSV